MALLRSMVLALLCLLMLCSCNFIIADTESLLTPPTLNQQQAEVNSALDSILNKDDITYRYPQRGEYRSPFVFFDMDGDGKKEAIFFYTFNSDPTSSRVLILRHLPSGQWEPVGDLASVSDQVNFVQFSHLLNKDSYCMIVGWRSTMGQESLLDDNFLSVYSLSPEGEARIEVQRQPYIQYMVQDFDGDGLDEIVTVERDRAQAMYVTLLRSVGRSLDSFAVLPLNSQAERLLNMTSGVLWYDRTRALYVDEVRSDGSTATEIFRVDAAGLTLLVGGEPPVGDEYAPEWEEYTFTWRDEAIISRDYNEDGHVEVPELTAVPGTVEEEESPLWLVRLMIFTIKGFDTTGESIVINETDGYLVYFPDNWLDRVTVARDDEIHEWKFFLLDEAGEPATELLRITTYSGIDDGPVGANEIDLGTFGTRRYTAYIPTPGPGIPSIDEARLHEMFRVLPQAQ